MKLEITKPVDGQKWIPGHTIVVSEDFGLSLIESGNAIIHPTVTDPGPERPCPCQDTDEPCEECDEETNATTEIVDDTNPKEQ